MKRVLNPSILKWMICGLISVSSIHATTKNPIIHQGNAKFETSEESTVIVTTSDKVHLSYEDFSIDENESIQIYQPSAASSVVIQVEGKSTSILSGTLKSNGQIFLINPNGINIHCTGYIEAKNFLASTFPTCACTLLDENDETFFQGDSTSHIINSGRIHANERNVYLISYKIENKGAIDAPLGAAILAAGREILFKPQHAQKITVLTSLFKEENENTGIDNSGMIKANQAELRADGNSYSVAIRHAGLIDVFGVEGTPSTVCLYSDQGNSGIFGAITAENSDGTGGSILISGENIAFFENSTIDASGSQGGGTILIGQANSGSIAKTTFIDEEVVISADAICQGNGGKIIVSSEEITRLYGTISTCGGEESGNGGVIGIFGPCKLDFKGEVDQSAPKGKAGNLEINTH